MKPPTVPTGMDTVHINYSVASIRDAGYGVYTTAYSVCTTKCTIHTTAYIVHTDIFTISSVGPAGLRPTVRVKSTSIS